MDSKARRSLYEVGFWSLSTLLLQQSVEKLAKSYLLTFGVVEIKDLRNDIGHDSPLVFTKIAERFTDLVPMIKSANTEIKTNYQALNDLVDNGKLTISKGPSPHEMMLLS
jgi:HEPN domain-containing protein